MIGLIDGGGGMRGVYSAGIYDYLLDKGIDAEYCLGVSAGAANMMSYLAKQRDRNKRFYTDYILRKEYMSMHNFFKCGSYLDVDWIYSIMTNSDGEDPIDYDVFKESKTAYTVAATCAQTGEQHFFTKRNVAQDSYDILKASSAVPIACKPYPVGGRLYFDGGVSEPIPYKKALDDGCDKLVVILTKPKDFLRSKQSNMPMIRLWLRKYPQIVRAIGKRHVKYNAALEELKRMEQNGRVLIVAPEDISGMKTLTRDLPTINRLYEDGYADGKRVADFLKMA